MKRVLCRDHVYLALNKKPISVVDNKALCSKCRWELRPWSISRIITSFKLVVSELEESHKDPYYDQFGYGLLSAFELATVRLLQKIHPEYRKDLTEAIIKETKALTQESDKRLGRE